MTSENLLAETGGGRKRHQVGTVELLEERMLLSTIGGRTFEDISADGFTSDDRPLEGRSVVLRGELSSLVHVDFSDAVDGASLEGFTADGPWHATSQCATDDYGITRQEFAYFGYDTSCSFEAGHQTGSLASGAIAIPASGVTRLTFDYRLDGEAGSTYDVASVQVSTDGVGFTTVATDADGTLPESRQWSNVSLDLSSFAG